jgi:hypothetical protein
MVDKVLIYSSVLFFKKPIKFNPRVSREVNDQHMQCSLVMGINNVLTIYLKDINE